jgi:hypothetical protein
VGHAGPLALGAEYLELADDGRGGGVGWHVPGVGHPGRPADRGVAVRRHPDRRARALEGQQGELGVLQLAPGQVRVNGLAAPQSPDDVEVGGEPPHLFRRINAEGGVFRVPVAEADPEHQPPAGQHVKGGVVLGRFNRIDQAQQDNSGAELHVSGIGRRVGQQGQRLQGHQGFGQVVLPDHDRVPAPVPDEAERLALLGHGRGEVGARAVLMGQHEADAY